MINNDSQDFYKVIASNIRDIRLKHKMAQELLADRLNMSRVSIVNIEKGRQRPSVHLLYQIAAMFKIDVSDLFPKFYSQNDDESSLIKQVGEIPNASTDDLNIISSFLNTYCNPIKTNYEHANK